MEHKNKINHLQLIALVQAGIIGISIIELPAVIIREAANDAWISILIGGLITLFFALSTTKLSLYYPEYTFVEYIPKIYGKMIGYIINGITIIYFISFIALSARLFANAVSINLLNDTPQWAVLLIFWAVIAYSIKSGIKVIVLAITILFIPMLIAFGMLALLPISKMEFENILPVFSNGFMPIFQGAYKIIPYYFGYATLGFIIPVIKEPKRVYNAVIIGVLIPTGIILLLIILLICRFSVEEVQNMLYPVVILIKSFKLPGAFIERMESLFFIVFITIALDNIAIYMYLTVLSLVRWTKKQNYTVYIIILTATAFVLSIIPVNSAYVIKGFDYLTYMGLLFVLIIIPFGLVITIIKRRGSNK